MIKACLSIAVTSTKLKAACDEIGHSAFVVPLNTQFAKRANEQGAELVICDLKDDFEGLREAKNAVRWFNLPAIVVSETDDEAIRTKVGSTSVSECLFLPYSIEELRPIIARTMTRHYRETEKLAQGILMGQYRLTENESYKRLQEDASKTGATLYEQALEVIKAAEDDARQLEKNAEEPWSGADEALRGSGSGHLRGPTSGKGQK